MEMSVFGKKQKLALCFLILLVVLPNVCARDFIIHNTSNESQTYFVVNGTTGGQISQGIYNLK